MTRHHACQVLSAAEANDPERIAICEALAFGKAIYGRRSPCR